MQKIKLMPDYHAYPVWWNDDVTFGDIDPEELPISAELAAALSAWSDEYDAIFDEDDPAAAAFASPEAEAAFDAQGRQLWQRLQGELGAGYEVSYFSVVSRKLAPPAGARPFNPTEINAEAWRQFEQALDAEQRAGKTVDLKLQVVNLPDADRRPIVLGASYTVDGLPFYHAFHYHNGAAYDLSDATEAQLYQAVGGLIQAAISEPWQEAWVSAELHADDHGLLAGRYLAAGQERGFPVDYQLFFALRELRTRANPPWVTATVTLGGDGQIRAALTGSDGSPATARHQL